ncbi:MAG: hypothetical protein IJ426_05955 [Clostridia bacterium]|nr:hypothetical protein [Clostridia bacterium]
MNEDKNILEKLRGKTGKIVFVLGIAGILLIFLSSLLPKGEGKKTVSQSADTTEQYCRELEEKVSRLVKSITGSKRVSVVITLDSGKQYVYADEGRHSQSETGDSGEQSYTIIRSSDGEESGLLVTEYQPIVRGVAIVCSSLGSQKSDAVSAAVCAALDVSERKVYVTQYAY